MPTTLNQCKTYLALRKVEKKLIPDLSNPDGWRDIKALIAKWCPGGTSSQTEVLYVPKDPVIGAFYMAHFNKHDEPYLIEHDLVTPPLELQRLISSWIEHSFEKDMPSKTAYWIIECDQEVAGVDPNVATDGDIYLDRIGETTSTNKPTTKLVSSASVDRVGFL
ncbi:hypothetical protein BGZ54_006311 [Gamsiella multidivaricata]|nr:hypothetical protein BGZ54_006311 [Gamsiella multidivaricata]